MGWSVAFLSVAPIPLVIIYVFLTTKGNNFMDKLKKSFKPTEEWVPADSKLAPAYRKTWYGIETEEPPDELYEPVMVTIAL